MKIGLIDVDSHNFPSLPLMKISAYHKEAGDHVEFVQWEQQCEEGLISREYDRIYMSKVFTESKEPEGKLRCWDIRRGGSGYDLENRLPDEIEHIYPDYSLYSELTKDTAYGWLTRGCPRCNHSFCITPEKDGIMSVKVADLDEFWRGQKNIILYDQNILACKDRIELLDQLSRSGASVEFNGGIDVRYLDDEVTEALRVVRVKDYHFAWDDPRENLTKKFQKFADSGLKNPRDVGVYVLVNYWSTHFEDLYRIYTLRAMGFMPFVMIYDKQKFVDSKGHWIKGVEKIYTRTQLQHFKICQHMQRWCGNRKLIKSTPNFEQYERYRSWKEAGMPVPGGN